MFALVNTLAALGERIAALCLLCMSRDPSPVASSAQWTMRCPGDQERARRVRFAIVAEIVDAAGSQIRKQLEACRLLPENVLGFAGACSLHRMRVVASTCTKETQTIGDVNAVVYVTGRTSHHQMVLKVFHIWLAKGQASARITQVCPCPARCLSIHWRYGRIADIDARA